MTPDAADAQVVLIDDHAALRKGIELLLRADGMHVIGSTDSAAEGHRMIIERRPDVAVVDIGLEHGSGLELTRRVLAERPETKILLYTGGLDRDRLRAGLESGARGFALKAGSPHELIGAIRQVAQGGEYFDPRLTPHLDSGGGDKIKLLSRREREILDLLADGLSGDDVAERLVLSPQTVQTHVRNLMRKLGAHSRVHALALALRQREIEL